MALRGEYCMAMLGVAGEDGLEAGFELLPGGVLGLGAGEGIEAAGLDAVDELFGLADGGDEVEPAAGDVQVVAEAEDAIADGIAIVMVVEQPAVYLGVAQCRLNLQNFHFAILIGSGCGMTMACVRAVWWGIVFCRWESDRQCEGNTSELCGSFGRIFVSAVVLVGTASWSFVAGFVVLLLVLAGELVRWSRSDVEHVG